MANIAIFASGEGTNAEALIKHFNVPGSANKVVLVLSNKIEAGVLTRAKKCHVQTYVFTRVEFQQASPVLKKLLDYGVDFVVLAGFLWLIPKAFTTAFPNRIINIHPALLPKFGGKGMYGLHVHRAVKQAGELETGITIHLVNEEYDKGRILLQANCLVSELDTPESIQQKVHTLEHAHFAPCIENYLNSALSKI